MDLNIQNPTLSCHGYYLHQLNTLLDDLIFYMDAVVPRRKHALAAIQPPYFLLLNPATVQ
jgi:hypothetical protein